MRGTFEAGDGAPATKDWWAGQDVRPGANIAPGTPIATFQGGVFPNATGYHAAIYLGQDSMHIIVLEQYNGLGAITVRAIPWNPRPGSPAGGNGYAYSAVLW